MRWLVTLADVSGTCLLICPADTQGQWKLATPCMSAKDKRGLDRKTRQCSSLALCKGITQQSFLPNRQVWRCESHDGITVNSKQPLIHEQAWSSLPTPLSLQTSPGTLPMDEVPDSAFLATLQQWCPFSSLALSPVGGDWSPFAFQLNSGHWS